MSTSALSPPTLPASSSLNFTAPASADPAAPGPSSYAKATRANLNERELAASLVTLAPLPSSSPKLPSSTGGSAPSRTPYSRPDPAHAKGKGKNSRGGGMSGVTGNGKGKGSRASSPSVTSRDEAVTVDLAGNARQADQAIHGAASALQELNRAPPTGGNKKGKKAASSTKLSASSLSPFAPSFSFNLPTPAPITLLAVEPSPTEHLSPLAPSFEPSSSPDLVISSTPSVPRVDAVPATVGLGVDSSALSANIDVEESIIEETEPTAVEIAEAPKTTEEVAIFDEVESEQSVLPEEDEELQVEEPVVHLEKSAVEKIKDEQHVLEDQVEAVMDSIVEESLALVEDILEEPAAGVPEKEAASPDPHHHAAHDYVHSPLANNPVEAFISEPIEPVSISQLVESAVDESISAVDEVQVSSIVEDLVAAALIQVQAVVEPETALEVDETEVEVTAEVEEQAVVSDAEAAEVVVSAEDVRAVSDEAVEALVEQLIEELEAEEEIEQVELVAEVEAAHEAEVLFETKEAIVEALVAEAIAEAVEEEEDISTLDDSDIVIVESPEAPLAEPEAVTPVAPAPSIIAVEPVARSRSSSTSSSSSDSALPLAVPAPSLTLAIASAWSSTTWTQKIPAVLASVFINFGLPFINGVMLGFGELFAREVLGLRLGWGSPFASTLPGAAAGGARANTAGVGLRAAGSSPLRTTTTTREEERR